MRQWLYILILIGAGPWSFAQVQFRTKVSQREVQVGQRFQVEFTVNEEGDGFRAPSWQGFDVLNGPNYSVSTYMDNSGTRFQLSYSYVIRARKLGEFTIDPAFIKVRGKTYRTDPVKIKVVAQRSSAESRKRELIFLKALVDKREVYQGEPIFAKYRMYYRVGVGQHQFKEEPEFQGFYKEEVDQNTISSKREILDNVEYNAADLRKMVLIPQKAGTYDAELVELVIPIQYPSGKRDYYGFPQYVNRDAELRTKFPTLKVKPLPTKGRPQNFSGAVGKYSMQAQISGEQVSTDGSISLKIRIEGQGNIKLVDLPKVEFPSAFEVFDPEIKERSTVGTYGMRGFKEIEYLLVPRYSGTYKIEPIEFSFFNPKTGSYKRLSSDPFEITVSGDAKAPLAGNSAGADAQEDVDFINKDILFIKTSSGPWLNPKRRFLGSQGFWILLGLPLLIAAGMIVWWLRLRSELENRDSLRVQRAGKAAKKKLRKAQLALKNGDAELFYQELETAVYGFFSAKFSTGISQMSKDYLQEELQKSKADASQIEALMELLQKAEMARYTGLKMEAAEQDYQHAMELLTEIDKQL